MYGVYKLHIRIRLDKLDLNFAICFAFDIEENLQKNSNNKINLGVDFLSLSAIGGGLFIDKMTIMHDFT